MLVNRSLAVTWKIPICVICHIDDGWFVISFRFKNHIQFIALCEWIRSLDVEFPGITFFHIGRNSWKYNGNAIRCFLNRCIPQTLIHSLLRSCTLSYPLMPPWLWLFPLLVANEYSVPSRWNFPCLMRKAFLLITLLPTIPSNCRTKIITLMHDVVKGYSVHRQFLSFKKAE